MNPLEPASALALLLVVSKSTGHYWDDTFNGHARLALIEHKGLRMEDAPPVFYMGVDSNGRCVAPRIKPGLRLPLKSGVLNPC